MSDSGNRLRFTERLALHAGPVPIRLVLALTFMWAGLGKILATFEPAEGDRQRFVEMGVLSEPAAGQEGSGTPSRDGAGPDAGGEGSTPTPSEGGQVGRSPDAVGHAPELRRVSTTWQPATAGPVELRRVYGIALTLSKGASPDEIDGSQPPAIVPSFVGSGRTPVYLAWAAAIAEVVCAALVFIGLFTRVGAVGLLGVMAVAMWLTTFGPAYQSGSGFLVFLPGNSAFDTQAWKTPLWQLALLCASLALALTGPGALSAHHFLFVGGEKHGHLDDEDDED